TAGAAGAAGGGASGGAGGAPVTACSGADCVIAYPDLPGATKSPLYTVKVNGKDLFVEKLGKFMPEMQVHYAHASLAGTATAEVSVTVAESFTSFKLSPKSRNLAATKAGNTLTFSTGPNYLVLTIDSKELLFILLDAEELGAPKLGDPDVKSIADYDVDATGATLETAQIQMAIDAASGATQNILYFPPGRYQVGELWLKSNMTLYLAGGALLYGASSPSDFETGSGGVNIEDCSHGMIRMYQIENTKVLGRGVIDANGKAIRAQNDTKINLFKIEESTDILVDGILVRDPSFWNTLIYRSDQVTFQNYKMINCRPTTTTYNNTDGVNFDESTNGKLYNAFLYTGDDSMATKNEEPAGTVNTKNILHEKVVCYSNSVCAKIGTKTMGQSMDNVVFRDIDVVKAGRALNIDAYDTAVVSNTRFEDIRIEAADSSAIALEEADPPDWREAANQSIIQDTYFVNVTSDSQTLINLHGRSAMYGITGVHFENVKFRGQPITSQGDTDAMWSVNSFVSNLTFE
ncbi:MAG: glycosyl hydrolase family 28 protein, partial [Myxococcota bacterium]|nr:glycosyl hydrolase family 28 protein [Myxococcota bacterium]